MTKKAMIKTMQTGKYDIFQTPEYAIKPLLKYIPDNVKTIWECCDPNWSLISSILKNNNYNVVSTDITTGFDFLINKPDFEFDMIITNPPYSLKTHFLEKCYEYKKNFALLMPLTALEGVSRHKYYRKYGINILIFDKRVDFIKSKKHGVWFAVGWFIYYENKENNRIFFETLLNKYNKKNNSLPLFYI